MDGFDLIYHYQMEQGGEDTLLDWVCRLTLFIVPALSIPGTWRAWRQRALGVGGRRPEPTVAALICNLAWVVYGYQVAEHKWEPVSLNAWGGLLQLVYLITFLALCTTVERDRVRVPMLYGFIYLWCTYLIGELHADAFKWLCTVAGCVAATAPLLSIAFLSEEWTSAVFPYWGFSAFSMVHGILWVIRGSSMGNDHNQTEPKSPNYSMVTQNVLGTGCSLLLMLFGLCWPYAHVQPTAQDAQVRASITRPDIVETARTRQNQGVILASQLRRRTVAQEAPPPPQPAVQEDPQPPQLAAPEAPPPPQPAVQEDPQPPQLAAPEAPPPPQPAVQEAPQPPQPAAPEAPQPPQPAGQEAPEQQQPAGQEAPPPPQPVGQEDPPLPQAAVQEALQPPQPAGQEAPEQQQPAGQEAPEQQQPAGRRRSRRLQALVQTSGGDQVAPATPSTSTSSSHRHTYMTRQNARATGQAVSIDIPEPVQRGANHSGRF
ncbi:hypothetical protein D1007_36301 [Hordeum vulgare]|nr:hypothetical protein D1007_36301 [Hordeum vulgare]